MNSFPTIEFNEQAGGNTGFLFAPANFINNIPAAVNGIVNQDISMVSPYQFLEGYAAQDSLSLDEPMEQSSAGNIWQPVVKGFYPKYTDDINNLMHEMASYRFVLIVTDKNGVKRIIGNKEEPLKFRYRMASGLKASDRGGLEFEFSGNCTSPSPVFGYEAAPAS